MNQQDCTKADEQLCVARVQQELQTTIDVYRRAAANSALLTTIARVSERCIDALRAGRKLLFAGNGGSAGDSQHLAAEFVVRFTVNRPALPAIALTVDTSILTACANDYGYSTVFARQVEALGTPGDVFFGISTSGNSSSIVCALEAARSKGLTSVGMTGESGGQIAQHCDFLINVPSDRTQNIQELHIMLGHTICGLVEQALFPEHFPDHT